MVEALVSFTQITLYPLLKHNKMQFQSLKCWINNVFRKGAYSGSVALGKNNVQLL